MKQILLSKLLSNFKIINLLIQPIIMTMMIGCISISNIHTQSNLLVKADSLRGLNERILSDSLYHIVKRSAELERNWQEWYQAVNGMRKNAKMETNFISFADSLLLYRKNVPEDELEILGKINFYIGSFLTKVGRNVNASKYFREALPYFKELNDSIYYSSTIINTANNFSRLGDQQSALKTVDEGIRFLNGKNPRNYNTRLKIVKGQYLLHNNDNKNAIRLFEKLVESSKDPNEVLLYLAFAHIQNGSLEDAKFYLEKLEEPKSWQKFDIYLYKSLYHEKKNDISNALKYQRQVINLTAEGFLLRTHTRELTRYADLLLRDHKFEEALQYAQLAIHQLRPEIDTSNYYSSPKIAGPPEQHLVNAFYIKAKCHNRAYKLYSKPKDLKATAQNYDLMYQMYDDLKKNVFTNHSRYRIGAFSQEMYYDAIQFYLDSYDQSQNVEDYNHAFRIAQLANSFVLRNTVTERKALEYAKVPTDKANEFLELKAELASAYNADETPKIEKQLLAFGELKNEIETNYPGYLSYSSKEIISYKELQENLDSDEILLKYYYHDKHLIIFSITRLNISHHEITLSEDDLNDIKKLNETIVKTPSSKNVGLETDFTFLSNRIYELIFKPLEDKPEFARKENIYIIPDGPMKNISFNSLMKRDTKRWSDVNDFLISEYNFRYLYYASQIADTGVEQSYKNNFVGFGIQYQDDFLKSIIEDYFENKDSLFLDGSRSVSLSVLNHAIDEVIACADLLGGISFTEEFATHKAIEENISNSQISHFAVHALVDKDDFSNSYILLQNRNEETQRFGYKDILNLELDCDLVVLSACQTGIGQNVVGEGLMSLARAFVQSGSKSSLGTYWNVPDKNTKQIMTLFYTNLKKGLSKSEAIRAAQIEYLSNDDLSSPVVRAPYYWAGWTMYGSDGTINLDIEYSVSPIIFILLLVLSLMIFFFLRQKNKQLGQHKNSP